MTTTRSGRPPEVRPPESPEAGHFPRVTRHGGPAGVIPPNILSELLRVGGAAFHDAGSMSVRAKSLPLNSSGSPSALASA